MPWTPDWDDFTAAILRGEVTYEPRMIAAPVRIPLHIREGGIYELQRNMEKPILGKM